MRIFHRYVILNENKSLISALDLASVQYTLDGKQSGDLISGEFILYEDDPQFARKREAVAQLGLFSQEGTEFSPGERESAEWNLLHVGQQGYPQPEDTWFDRTYRVESSCKTCGCAEEQVAPFRFKSEPKSKHSPFLGLNWVGDAIFVRDDAKALLERERVAGIQFTRPLLHRTGQPLESVWQLEVTTVLPPGLETSNVTLEPCDRWAGSSAGGAVTRLSTGPFCQRRRYNYPTRGMATFLRTAFDGMPDIVRCREWFGSGGSASRPVLVSRRVKRLIEDAHLRGAVFAPLSLV